MDLSAFPDWPMAMSTTYHQMEAALAIPTSNALRNNSDPMSHFTLAA